MKERRPDKMAAAAIDMHVRPATTADAVDIAYIYNYYIATSHCTFEVEPLGMDEMELRIGQCLAGGYPFLVADDNDEVVGYAYGHEYRQRTAYRHSIEISVYVRPGHDGKSIGSGLYTALFDEIKNGEFHAVVAGISLPNEASIRLHEKFGMQKVAHFREVGRKFDKWIDVAYWELVLDNRL